MDERPFLLNTIQIDVKNPKGVYINTIINVCTEQLKIDFDDITYITRPERNKSWVVSLKDENIAKRIIVEIEVKINNEKIEIKDFNVQKKSCL